MPEENKPDNKFDRHFSKLAELVRQGIELTEIKSGSNIDLLEYVGNTQSVRVKFRSGRVSGAWSTAIESSIDETS